MMTLTPRIKSDDQPRIPLSVEPTFRAAGSSNVCAHCNLTILRLEKHGPKTPSGVMPIRTLWVHWHRPGQPTKCYYENSTRESVATPLYHTQGFSL